MTRRYIRSNLIFSKSSTKYKVTYNRMNFKRSLQVKSQYLYSWSSIPTLFLLNSLFNPPGVVGHLGIYSILALFATPLSKRCDAIDGPPVTRLTQERTSAVSSTTVDPSASVSGTEHVVCDVVVLVDTHTVGHAHNGNLQYVHIKNFFHSEMLQIL